MINRHFLQKYRIECFRKYFNLTCFAIIFLHIFNASLFSEQHLPNTLTIKNASEEEVLVKLQGPSGQVFPISKGETGFKYVLPGKYTVFARYGKLNSKYKYFQCPPFEIGNPCGLKAQIRKGNVTSTSIVLVKGPPEIQISFEDFSNAKISDLSKVTGAGAEDDPVNKFIAAFDQASKKEKTRIVEILGECSDPRTMDVLKKALKDEADNVRWGAAKALSKNNFLGSVDLLISTLDDNAFVVRQEALHGLRSLKDSKATAAIIKMLRERGELKKEAAWALGEIGDPQAVEPLIELLQDKDEEAREYAAHALSKIKDPSVDQIMILGLMRIPTHFGHPFRRIPAGHSD